MFCWLTHLRIFCKYQLSIQKMYIAVTSFNILCCSKCRFFTHSTVWWNPRNTLITTFIHRNVSVYKLKTIEFSLVFLWMFFKITFSRPHVVFVILYEGELGCHAHHVQHHPVSETQHALVLRLLFEPMLALFRQISSITWCTHSVLHVMNIWYGHILDLSVYLNSYWIYWFWKCFWLLLFNCGKII